MKYSGQNSITKLMQLVKNRFDSMSVVRGSVNISSTTSTINIPITVVDTNNLEVYHNGILLDPTEHYTISGTTAINLIDYTAESGDVITFVYHNM